jgi:CheY-like chemotaxis protein
LDFRSQVRQDLASLQMGAPGVVADVGDTIDHAVERESVLASRYGVSLVVGQVQPHLVAAIHPAALRQILIMAIAQLARCISPGPISIHAALEAGLVRITLAGAASEQDAPPDCDLIREILASQGGSIQASATGGRVTCSVRVPVAGEITVLVVDDNLDQVHFYRRCAAGTRYRILHALQGQRTVEALAALAPDIVVLDIMLPDADGWDLLAHLREHPVTRSLPVVICSIVREEDLALTLGAALYLPKPVQRLDFIGALDRVSAGAPRTLASTAAAC